MGGSNFQLFFESDNTISYHYFTGDVHLGMSSILTGIPGRYMASELYIQKNVLQSTWVVQIFNFFLESDNTISYHYFTGDVHLGMSSILTGIPGRDLASELYIQKNVLQFTWVVQIFNFFLKAIIPFHTIILPVTSILEYYQVIPLSMISLFGYHVQKDSTTNHSAI
jgi:hypothetical protein